MKKGIFIISFFLVLVSTQTAQHYRVGSGFTVGLPNNNQNLGGGFNLFVEYKSTSPFSFRTSGGFSISKFKDSNPYTNGKTTSLYWIEGSLIYAPFQSEYEPYIGGGIGYYFITAEDFNEVKTLTGNYSPQELSNKFSYHAEAGFIYPISESIKLHAQVKYLYLPKEIIIQSEETINEELIKRTIEEDFDLSTIYITVGLVFKI